MEKMILHLTPPLKVGLPFLARTVTSREKSRPWSCRLSTHTTPTPSSAVYQTLTNLHWSLIHRLRRFAQSAASSTNILPEMSLCQWPPITWLPVLPPTFSGLRRTNALRASFPDSLSRFLVLKDSRVVLSEQGPWNQTGHHAMSVCRFL